MLNKLIVTESQYNRLLRLILEFTNDEFKQIFVIGNVVSFFIKNDGEEPTIITVKLIPPPTNEIPNFQRPNVIFGSITSKYPAQYSKAIIAINNEPQNIKSGTFKFTIIGTLTINGIVPLKNENIIEKTLNNLYKVTAKNSEGKLIGDYFANDNDSVEKPIDDDKPNNDSDEETGVDGEDTTDSAEEAKEMMQSILNDPLMKKAFYRQPTLWNIIMSTIKGKNPKGTGIGPAKDIISKYGNSKQVKKLGLQGENFKREKWARFKVLYREIIINPTGQPQDVIKLLPNEEYQAFVLKNELGNDDPLTLINKKRGYKIEILKPYKDVADAFEVSVIRTIENKGTGQVKDYKKSGIIQFVSQNGSGYSKKETKKEPAKPAEPVNTTK